MELEFSYINQPNAVKVVQVDKKTSRKYINWGEDNKLPDYIWDSYLACSNLQALVNTVSDYCKGDGIHTSFVNFGNDSIESVIRRCVFDFVLFGGFAVECIRSAQGRVSQVKYINVMSIRVDEDLTTAYLSNQWGSYDAKKMQTLPLFDGSIIQTHFVYYYRGSITRNINPIPMWFAALKSVDVLNESRNYNLNNIHNNFNANLAVVLNGTHIKSSEKDEIKKKLEIGYSGSDNAGKSILIDNANTDGKVEIQRLDGDKTVDMYKSVQESSIDDLYVAFRINPLLVGINQQTGFNTQEYSNAFKLYDKTVVSPLQKEIVSVFAMLDININFDKFVINFD